MKTKTGWRATKGLGIWVMTLAMVMGTVACGYAQEEVAEDTYDGFVLGISEIPGLDPALDAFTEKSPLAIELGFTLANAYIWRGQKLGSDTSFQPYITVGPNNMPEEWGYISFTCWANITHDHDFDNHSETDFSIDYSIDILDLGSFSTGYIYYDFPYSGGGSTEELYWGLSANLPLSPSVTWYHDWKQGSGEWISFGISHDFDLGVATIATYADVNYTYGQWGADSGFANIDFGVSLPIPVGTHMTIEPFISYSKVLEENRTLLDDELYGGFNYSISF